MNVVKQLLMPKKKSTRKKQYTVTVMNDDHNTFDFVIELLQEVCGHNYLQAVQCTHLIDSKGYCDVFTDNPEIATQIYESLAKEGLTVTLKK